MNPNQKGSFQLQRLRFTLKTILASPAPTPGLCWIRYLAGLPLSALYSPIGQGLSSHLSTRQMWPIAADV